jgi:NADH:ubiquinone oxidoreductase subunit H
MNLGWKIMIPLSIFNIVLSGLVSLFVHR